MTGKIVRSEAEWRKILSSGQYRVLREGATECAFSGKLEGNKKRGSYFCAGCGQSLFRSGEKFESKTGWPSFFAPVAGGVEERTDTSYGMKRTEVLCSACGGHLGHVFEDGPRPTGKRYCINSAALNFRGDE